MVASCRLERVGLTFLSPMVYLGKHMDLFLLAASLLTRMGQADPTEKERLRALWRDMKRGGSAIIKAIDRYFDEDLSAEPRIIN